MAALVPRLAHTAALILALPAAAQDTHTWGSAFYPSTIQLQPTTVQGAVAQVVFDNRTVHLDEKVVFDLTMNGFTVTVEAIVGRGMTPDEMTVMPPDGFLAVPPTLAVAEDDVGLILIVPWIGY